MEVDLSTASKCRPVSIWPRAQVKPSCDAPKCDTVVPYSLSAVRCIWLGFPYFSPPSCPSFARVSCSVLAQHRYLRPAVVVTVQGMF